MVWLYIWTRPIVIMWTQVGKMINLSWPGLRVWNCLYLFMYRSRSSKCPVI